MAKEPAFDLPGLLKAVKLKSHNCAIYLGKENPVIAADPRKNADMLFKQAKAAGGGMKGIVGTMAVEGGILTIRGTSEPPPQLLKGLKAMIKDAKLTMRVQIFGPSGVAVEEEGEAPAAPAAVDPGAAPLPGAEAEPDPETVKRRAEARDGTEKAASRLSGLSSQMDEMEAMLRKLEGA